MPRAARGRGTAGDSKIWRDKIRVAVLRADESGDGKVIDKLVEALIASAKAGDMQALNEIGNRLDGKPHQTQDTNITMTAGEAFVEMLRMVNERRAQAGAVAEDVADEPRGPSEVRH